MPLYSTLTLSSYPSVSERVVSAVKQLLTAPVQGHECTRTLVHLSVSKIPACQCGNFLCVVTTTLYEETLLYK